MNTKLLAIALAALVVTVGAAAAVGSTMADENALDSREAAIDASYDNGTVTSTITNGGDPVENATVEINGEMYTTDTNGTVTADVGADADEVEIEFETDHLTGSSEYAIIDGELVLQEEEYEYEADDEEEAEDDEEVDDEEETEDDEDDDKEDDGEST